MDVLVTDLDEDRSRFSEKVASERELLKHLVEVAVDAPLVGIAKRADHLGIGGQALTILLGLSLPHRYLEVRLEADPVGGIEQDHLDLAV